MRQYILHRGRARKRESQRIPERQMREIRDERDREKARHAKKDSWKRKGEKNDYRFWNSFYSFVRVAKRRAVLVHSRPQPHRLFKTLRKERAEDPYYESLLISYLNRAIPMSDFEVRVTEVSVTVGIWGVETYSGLKSLFRFSIPNRNISVNSN
jgi:hypothetical protein